MDAADTSVSVLFFWTFMMMCYFILINAFLAIIVEAYEQTKSGFDEISYTDSFWHLLEMAKWWKKPKDGDFYLDDEEVKEVLDWVLGIFDAERKEEDIPSLISDTERCDKFDRRISSERHHRARALLLFLHETMKRPPPPHPSALRSHPFLSIIMQVCQV